MIANAFLIEKNTTLNASILDNDLTTDMKMSMRYEMGSAPYDGSYTIEPGAEEQIIPIKMKYALEDIVIKPIPSNYGLITWTGSKLIIT